MGRSKEQNGSVLQQTMRSRHDSHHSFWMILPRHLDIQVQDKVYKADEAKMKLK